MILKLVFQPINNEEVNLPVHYNRPLQGLFYNLMGKIMPDYHDDGTVIENKKLKLFTFSRIYPLDSFKAVNKRMKFYGPFVVYFASPMREILNAIYESIEKEETFRIEKNYFILEKSEILVNEFENSLLVKTLSPITTYSTIILPNGNRYTHYFSPYSTDFKKLVEDNLKRKANAMNLELDEEKFSIEPYGITEKNEKLLFYKGIIIKGWTGYFKLVGNKKLIELAINSGLGAKNAQGFGMVIPADEKNTNNIELNDENIAYL
ncbi:CRISPR-associated endoribonuclease Cas6 [Oceanotoga teriensis]|uniref:CRISPR-associated endoribonuclease Cas6 n=1 Tax=Oceanotoga teriensis TaxID=515440 RepID=UPI002713F507|nr:CRISPR-associated endoribonuclease Cas6 [Oceanotoga teriensis]MDO7977656.1 CRISPR-associated endoribonuclease Cas6 [Oceanotoga teriensis]